MSLLSDLANIDLSFSTIGGDDPGNVEARRKLAMAMLARGQDTSGIRSTAQGLNSVLQSMLGAYGLRKADEAEKAQKKEADDLLAGVFGGAPAAELTPSAGSRGASGFTTSTASVSPSGGVRDDGGSFDPSDPLALIKKEEGFAPVAKWDKRQFSGGYGSRAERGETFTREKADEYLRRDAAGPIAWVERNAPNASPQQKAALVSFGYNLGEGALDRIGEDVRSGNWARVAERMPSFNKALNERTGKLEPMEALTNRRLREAALISGGGGRGQQFAELGGSRSDAAPAGQGANANTQRALALFRSPDPRVKALGAAMLQKIATADATPEKPLIIEVPGEDGGKVPMVFNQTTRKLEPISTLIAGGGGMDSAASAFQPANAAPEAQQAALAAGGEFSPAQARPAITAAAGASMLPGGDALPAEFIGDVGASGIQRAAEPETKAAAEIPAMPAREAPSLPDDALVGPEWRGKVPEGMVQRRTADGKPLYDAQRRPLFENKKAAETRAEADAGREGSQVDRQRVAKQFGEVIADIRSLPDQFGKIAFERAIGPLSATQPSGTGFLEQAISLPAQTGARLLAEGNALVQGGAAPTEVRDTIEQKMLALSTMTKPLVRAKGEGAWTDADQANLERLVGNVSRARDAAEFNRRVNQVVSTFEKAFGVDIPDVKPKGRSSDAPQTAEDAIREMVDENSRRRMEEERRRAQGSAPAAPVVLPSGVELPANLNPLLQQMLAR